MCQLEIIGVAAFFTCHKSCLMFSRNSRVTAQIFTRKKHGLIRCCWQSVRHESHNLVRKSGGIPKVDRK